jgi:hypothetical protein
VISAFPRINRARLAGEVDARRAGLQCGEIHLMRTQNGEQKR